MCGLVGVASATGLTKDLKNVFENLLFVDTVRGPHSTGVFSVDSKYDVNICKRVLDGPTFLQTNVYERLFRSALNLEILAGHNRLATKGKVSFDNTHPFHHNDIVLMHNGTLISCNNLDGNFETDSETIAYNISNVAPEDAHTVLSKLNGAFALVWYDIRDSSLNFVRNDERDLFLACNMKEDTLVWASESAMINWAVDRPSWYVGVQAPKILPKLVHQKFKFKGNHIDLVNEQKFKEYEIPRYSSLKNQVSNVIKKVKGTSKKSRDVALRPATPANYPKTGDIINVWPIQFVPYGYDKTSSPKGRVECMYDAGGGEILNVELNNRTYEDYENWDHDDWLLQVKVCNIGYSFTEKSHIIYCSFQNTITWEDSVEEEEIENQKIAEEHASLFDKTDATTYEKAYSDDIEPNSLQALIGFIPGPNKTLLTYSEYVEKTKQGCAYCSGNINFHDVDDLVWTNDYTPIHGECFEKWNSECDEQENF